MYCSTVDTSMRHTRGANFPGQFNAVSSGCFTRTEWVLHIQYSTACTRDAHPLLAHPPKMVPIERQIFFFCSTSYFLPNQPPLFLFPKTNTWTKRRESESKKTSLAMVKNARRRRREVFGRKGNAGVIRMSPKAIGSFVFSMILIKKKSENNTKPR